MGLPYASNQLAALTGGIIYCSQHLLPSVEGDLYDGNLNAPMGLISDPIPLKYGEGISAEVLFSPNQIASNPLSYVVLQTSWGDNNWFDVSWCAFTQTSAINNLFVLSSAGPAAVASYNQTRLNNTAPSPANGTNSFGLGELIRFTGKSSSTTSGSGSSGSSGVLFGMLVSIKYRIAPLR
jgi:hypothetical protein